MYSDMFYDNPERKEGRVALRTVFINVVRIIPIETPSVSGSSKVK